MTCAPSSEYRRRIRDGWVARHAAWESQRYRREPFFDASGRHYGDLSGKVFVRLAVKLGPVAVLLAAGVIGVDPRQTR